MAVSPLDLLKQELQSRSDVLTWIKLYGDASPANYYWLTGRDLLASLDGQGANSGQEGQPVAWPPDPTEPFQFWTDGVVNQRGAPRSTAQLIKALSDATPVIVQRFGAIYDSGSQNTYVPYIDGKGTLLGYLALNYLQDSNPSLPASNIAPISLPVPFNSQWQDEVTKQPGARINDCGPDCVLMLKRWMNAVFGLTDPIPTLGHLNAQTTLVQSDTGLMTSQLIPLAAAYNVPLYLVNGTCTLPRIDHELANNRPVLILIRYGAITNKEDTDQAGHFILVVGKNADGSYQVNDPDYWDNGTWKAMDGDHRTVSAKELDAALSTAEAKYQGLFVNLVVPSTPAAPPPVTPTTQPATLWVKSPVWVRTSGHLPTAGEPDNKIGPGYDSGQVTIDEASLNSEGYVILLAGDYKGDWIKRSYLDTQQPVPPPAPVPSANHILGVNIDPRNPAGNPTAAQLAGVSWVRLVFKAPVQGNVLLPVAQGFAFYDGIIAAYRAAGINILMVLNQETYAADWPVWFPQNLWSTFAAHFAAAVSQVVAHYKGQVQAYEIWNEPDDPAANSAAMAAGNFGVVLRAAIPAIRQADPAAKIITGGLTSGDPAGYLSGCGDLGQPDGIGLHPYLKSGAALSGIINAVAKYGPVWLTEYGVSAGDFTAAAAALTQGYGTAASLVQMYCWYAWSTGMNPSMACLVDASGKQNPSIYNAWQALITQDTQNSPVQPPSGDGSNSGSNRSGQPPSTQPPPPPATTPGQTRRTAGWGLYDPNRVQDFSKSFVDMCERLSNNGTPVEVVIVMDDPATANALLRFVKHVVHRQYDYEDEWNIPDDWTLDQVNKYADDLFTGYQSLLDQLDPRVIIEFECERNNRYWSGAFFLRMMQNFDREGKGRKVGIFTDSTGQPEDLTILKAREDAYRYAMAHGHYYLYHSYGDPTLPGHWNVLYEAMPADCRPRVLETESAPNEGYTSPEATVTYIDARETTLANDKYVDGYCYYGIGILYTDTNFIANAALPQFEAWRRTH